MVSPVTTIGEASPSAVVSGVPAAGVAAESMVALTLANLAQQKFGGDSVLEMHRNFSGYIEQIKHY